MPRGGKQNREQEISSLLRGFEVNPVTGCWRWLGYTRSGYGSIRVDSKNVHVHRIVACIHFGVDFDDARLVLHRCGNKLCINPTHLYLGSYSDNARDDSRMGIHRPVFGRKR